MVCLCPMCSNELRTKHNWLEDTIRCKNCNNDIAIYYPKGSVPKANVINNNGFKNEEGYVDSTSYKAIRNAGG